MFIHILEIIFIVEDATFCFWLAVNWNIQMQTAKPLTLRFYLSYRESANRFPKEQMCMLNPVKLRIDKPFALEAYISRVFQLIGCQLQFVSFWFFSYALIQTWLQE